MSTTNFYQAFYQNDQLFRFSNESWTTNQDVLVDEQPVADEIIATSDIAEKTGLLSELDALSASYDTDEVITVQAEQQPVIETILAVQEEVSIVTKPEPLPKPASRPALTPSDQRPVLPELNHKVLLLADEELDPSNLLFLEKILKAINLNIEGVDLLNLNGAHDLDFAALVQDKKIHHFITFGVPFNRIHLDIAMDRYQPIRFFGITFLMADSLPTIEADQHLKKRLWGALQRMFLMNRQ
ncbi:hypothetical protein GCM10028806_30080 [Spirosoma terrae]|uniref:Uncharacterized protein n=1 Tax=Spirosoma terrae TaxID=1968276 RepID=A0A6L9L7K3_9BACT|nr:hypothetical protein [Spirosoma terrae]NDU95322.1 hypothetical protein [Spirosoma terrae]